MKQLNNNLSEGVYLTVVEYVKQYNRLPVHPRGHQYYNRYIQRLKEAGILIKKGYGVWEAKELNKQLNNNPRIVRGHGFTFKVRIKSLKNWDRRKEYLDRKGIEYKALNKYQSIVFRGHTIWLCNTSIIIYTPENSSYYGNSAQDSERLVVYNLEQILIGLEGLLGVELKIGGRYQFKISKAHYGKIKDKLAEQCNKEGIKVYCYYNGEGWLVIDNSLNLNEIETIHPETSKKDMDKVILPVFNDYKDLFCKTGEIPLPSKILETIAGIVANQQRFDYNMASHIKAVQELGRGVQEFRSEIYKFRKAQEHNKQRKLNEFR